jgi:hypothetical protein
MLLIARFSHSLLNGVGIGSGMKSCYLEVVCSFGGLGLSFLRADPGQYLV